MASSPLVTLPIVALLLPLTARAASFDCGTARSAQERLVCATPSLSKLDDRLAVTFTAQLKRLSPEGQDLLRRDERLWLGYAETVCSNPRPYALHATPAACLTGEYTQRIRDLEETTTVTGRWTFQHVIQQRAVPVSDPRDETGFQPGFATERRSYLRVDAPQDEASRRWNAKVTTTLADQPDSDSNVDEDMKIELATPDFLCIESERDFYGHGTPHGTGNIGYLGLILSPKLRVATPDDLFRPGGRWRTIVADAIRKQVGEAATAAAEDNEFTRDALEKSIEADTASLSAWRIGRKEVTIQFNQYELSDYVFVPTVVVPWSALRSELRSDSPLAGVVDLSP